MWSLSKRALLVVLFARRQSLRGEEGNYQLAPLPIPFMAPTLVFFPGMRDDDSIVARATELAFGHQATKAHREKTSDTQGIAFSTTPLKLCLYNFLREFG